jgi:hypothetical protein
MDPEMTTAVAGVVAICVVKHGNEEAKISELSPVVTNPGGQQRAVVSAGSGKSEVGYSVHPDGHIPGE